MLFRGEEHIVWSLNNYLGLANHPEVRKADEMGASEHGLAYPMGGGMMSGNTSNHESLEKALAGFVGKADAFLMNYGSQGLVSIIDTLLSLHDVAVYEGESHGSIAACVCLHYGNRFSSNTHKIE